MSYETASDYYDGGQAATPMPYDILAIQQIDGTQSNLPYGKRRVGPEQDCIVRTIWDAGGPIDFPAVGLAQGATINLNEGALSSHGFISSTTIAFQTSIENAIGSSFDDTLIGNVGANLLDGKLGADAMSGGAGNDTYVVDNPGDTVSEADGRARYRAFGGGVHAGCGDREPDPDRLGGGGGDGERARQPVDGQCRGQPADRVRRR